MGFSKAMSSGWLQVNKTAEGGPRVMRKVRPTYFPGKATHAVDFSKFQGKQILVPKIEQFENSEIKLKGCMKKKPQVTLDILVKFSFSLQGSEKQFAWRILQFMSLRDISRSFTMFD